MNARMRHKRDGGRDEEPLEISKVRKPMEGVGFVSSPAKIPDTMVAMMGVCVRG